MRSDLSIVFIRIVLYLLLGLVSRLFYRTAAYPYPSVPYCLWPSTLFSLPWPQPPPHPFLC